MGRNDGYTPDYIRRVDRATNCLAFQFERARVASEIIIVEWNRVPSRPLLLEVRDLSRSLRSVTIRGFIVGPKYHSRHVGAEERGMHVGEAANVGIRRARGRFTTAKASDTFLSPQAIARSTGATSIRTSCIASTVTTSRPAIWDLDDDKLLATLATLPSVPHASIQQLSHWRLRQLHTDACGDFTLLDASYWQLLRGNPRDETVLALDIDSLLLQAAAFGVEECRWPPACKVYKPVHALPDSARISPV